jgi:hypothetical protein
LEREVAPFAVFPFFSGDFERCGSPLGKLLKHNLEAADGGLEIVSVGET